MKRMKRVLKVVAKFGGSGSIGYHEVTWKICGSRIQGGFESRPVGSWARQIAASVRRQLDGLCTGSHELTGSTADGDQIPVAVTIEHERWEK